MKNSKSPNNKQSIKKIILVGLDNSGKTSILLSLTRNSNLLSYYSLKPTAGLNIVNYNDSDTVFNIWDFGGQEQYRKEYMKKFDQYLDADKIIFVIDIQDTERYNLALNYLSEIVNLLQQKNLRIDFSIFLHKFDPSLERQVNFSDERIQNTLISKIQKIFPPNYPIEVFKTTIYTVFQKKPMLKG